MARSAVVSNFSFDNVPSAPIVTKKSKKMPSFDLPGVVDFRLLRKFIALGTAALASKEEAIKEAATTRLIALGVKSGKRPANFQGSEGSDEVTVIFSRRSYASALTDEEVEVLTEHDIPLETSTVPASFVFNSEYLDDPIWRKKITLALKGFPSDIILKTPASTRTVVSDDTIDAIFARRDPDLAEQLLPLVTTFSIRSKPNPNTDIVGLLTRVGAILGLPRLKVVLSKAA
jgi:hypothetical protein